MVVSRHQNAEKIIIHCLVINPLKMWQSSGILEPQQQTKIAFTKRLYANYIQEMLATIQFRDFCLTVSSLKT
jgi:hypothetical protein